MTVKEPEVSPPASGAPTRVWLNKEVSPALLEGMRMLARTKPQDPLRVLGQFLIDRSNEAPAKNEEAPSGHDDSVKTEN